eukprot:jgi/Mesen1/1299/ME000013S00787
MWRCPAGLPRGQRGWWWLRTKRWASDSTRPCPAAIA